MFKGTKILEKLTDDKWAKLGFLELQPNAAIRRLAAGCLETIENIVDQIESDLGIKLSELFK